MAFKKIVVAYDGSDHAKNAVRIASDLAKAFGSKVYVVEVVDTAAMLGMGLAPIPAEIINQIYEKARRDVNEGQELAKSLGVTDVEGQVLEGDPATSIIEFASKNGADLIVTGSRGLSTFKRVLLGSVSTKIVQESRIPVLVVK